MNTILFYYYIKYFFRRKTIYSVHSPFVYEFISKIKKNQEALRVSRMISKHRRRLSRNRNTIETVDFGTGSGEKKYTTYLERINKLAKKRSLSKYETKLLYSMAHCFDPKITIELGTAFGISTSALALANPQSTIYTIEGCANVMAIAEANFQKLDLKNIESLIGEFDYVLPELLEQIETIDMVFFDGNHRKNKTLQYFEWCKQKANADTVFIFNDIYLSHEMKEAWNTIISDQQVTISIDLFHFGVVFFRSGIEKQHFMLKI